MAYEESMRAPEIAQNIILENRRRLSVSAVKDVESFDEDTVIVETVKGMLIIHGSGLHMEKLSLDSGEVVVEGLIDSMEYENRAESGGGLFARLFR